MDGKLVAAFAGRLEGKVDIPVFRGGHHAHSRISPWASKPVPRARGGTMASPTSAAEPLPVPRRARSFVSARQVADLAGVSRSAVSRTVHGRRQRLGGTPEKGAAAPPRPLGYHVNHLARSLIQESSGIVCIVGAAIDTPYQCRILDAITRRLQAIDRVAMVINTSGDERQRRGCAAPDAELSRRRHRRACPARRPRRWSTPA